MRGYLPVNSITYPLVVRTILPKVHGIILDDFHLVCSQIIICDPVRCADSYISFLAADTKPFFSNPPMPKTYVAAADPSTLRSTLKLLDCKTTCV